jgi:cyclic beta-1,2-glucan synthetase
MPRNTHFEIASPEEEQLPATAAAARDPQIVRTKSVQLAESLAWLPNEPSSEVFPQRTATLTRAFGPIFSSLKEPLSKKAGEDFRGIYDSERLLDTELQNTVNVLGSRNEVPHVRKADGTVTPRALALAEGYLEAVSWEFSQEEFVAFVEGFQETAVLQSLELRMLVPAMKLVLLEHIAALGQRVIVDPGSQVPKLVVCIRSLQEIGHTHWKGILETLIVIDRILRKDPSGTYPEMDAESREFYRKKLSRIADHSDFPEVRVAERAIALAQEATRRKYSDSRIAARESHVGYYIVDKGAPLLEREVGYHAPLWQRLQRLLKDHPDEFYLVGIAVLTLAITSAAVLFLTDSQSSLGIIVLSLLLLLLPSSQSAVQLMQYLVTLTLPAEILAKLELEDGIPGNCVTMVAVPSLLLNEEQVRGLVEDLEVRFLGNHDPNIHFALLTDLPDSREPAREDNPLVPFCADLIEKLNEKYAKREMGSFFLFHRHRVYNPREKAWMGWERKRGKLLDFNKLLRGRYDSFPVKVGDLTVLPSVRFVMTLDSDTELPRGSARRMIGTLAHPLNQAIVDPEKNIVVAGYGILQPRVGVSVQSTARSRLAAIFAGETGFDVYTRAVSDAYQDLYGEGSFTGKGIYEVDVMHRVLDRRFPRNSLLSHDLIEGAYARAGLVSDIEVIEDYPSHYSAYNRRKHRWLRGDWQITAWLFPQVPAESGELVANPISLLSRWKIFDNLRRSLVEPATLLLILAGWFVFSNQPWQWTVAAVVILFLPTIFQFTLDIVRALLRLSWGGIKGAVTGLYTASINVLFTLIFLPHQTLLALDAVGRTLIRRFVTQRRLLEWETAAEAEMLRRRRGPVDAYLAWVPFLAVAIGALVWEFHPRVLPAALPILALWAGSKLFASWLNQPPIAAQTKIPAKDLRFLRQTALLTWRYFHELSTAEHHWLIPDNIQEQPPAVAARVSPTNLGMLLNARQAACEFGYLTAPEFAQLTQFTFDTIAELQKFRGHLLNWYDTRTLEPLVPRFVSSVDSGNLLASLWTLQQGCLEKLRQPVLQPNLAEGFLDHLRLLAGGGLLRRRVLSKFENQHRTDKWLSSILELPEETLSQANAAALKSEKGQQASWCLKETQQRLHSIREAVQKYAPWFLPEFASFRSDPALNSQQLDTIPLEQLPEFIDKLIARVDWAGHSGTEEQRVLALRFREQLLSARNSAITLLAELREIALTAGALADGMDFSFTLNRRRKLVSVGFNVEKTRLEPACYDLLASESRTAAFVAIAKEDIPQETWFLLGRAHTIDDGRPVLLSWSGTSFEYLMPSLWMRSFPNTLLERSRAGSVSSQQRFGERKGVPWGISESSYAKLDDAGVYGYYAFGLPTLALHKSDVDALVISPYSTMLALGVDAEAALQNLRRMEKFGWLGGYGFYESADFSNAKRRFWGNRHQIVRCWMAHHQGMSLLALTNFLHGNIVQKWFHAEPRVQASELLLHEKPVAYVPEPPRRRAVA